jgi:histidinol-phosphate aminotransferase
MWQGRLPRDLLRDTRESYVTRNTSHLRTEVPGGVVDCALGTNPLGIPDSVRAFLASPQNWDPGCYPPPDLTPLRETIAEYLGDSDVTREHIVLGHGSFGVLLTLLRILLPPGSLLGGVSPQFTDVPLQAMLNNVRYHPLILHPPLFEAHLDAWLRAARGRPHVLYVDRPHNPTGQTLTLAELEHLSHVCAKGGSWLLVDEAYGDYLPRDEWATRLTSPNVIVVRSFSKAWGLAGMRVGYGVTRHPELLELFRKVHPPFPVNTLGAILAREALSDSAFLERTKTYVFTTKTRLMEFFRKHSFLRMAATDPRTPILLLSENRGNLATLLGEQGIAGESGEGYMHLDERYVRLRIPSPEFLELFLERLDALKSGGVPSFLDETPISPL